jgi:hypothetical protein
MDINDMETLRSIAYIKKGIKLTIAIASDFNKVIFSNGIEHYMLNYKSQDNFPWIKDKFIRSSQDFEGEFYLITSKDYDRDIDIIGSKNRNFNASFDRHSEPGLFNVFDSKI